MLKAVVLAVAALLGITACAPPEPLKLGFIGGLSGRVADLGEAGRNGALLAVEDANAAGGIDGRKVELLVHDDEQKVDIAIREAESLAAARVAAIIGPMTSSMGEAILPALTRAGLVTVSPTITTSTLSAKDDQLFKVAPSAAESTRRSAAFEYGRGARRVAIVYDLSNRAFTADWAGHFRNAFVALGGSVVAESTFTSGSDASYAEAVKGIAASRADLLLFVASAVDTVQIGRAHV